MGACGIWKTFSLPYNRCCQGVEKDLVYDAPLEVNYKHTTYMAAPYCWSWFTFFVLCLLCYQPKQKYAYSRSATLRLTSLNLAKNIFQHLVEIPIGWKSKDASQTTVYCLTSQIAMKCNLYPPFIFHPSWTLGKISLNGWFNSGGIWTSHHATHAKCVGTSEVESDWLRWSVIEPGRNKRSPS